MADTNSQKRFRVYFEERSTTEMIVHASSAADARAHCVNVYRTSKDKLPDEFKVRTNTSEWIVEDLDQLEK